MSSSFPIKTDLPKSDQAELVRINAISSSKRSAGESAYLTSRLQYLTNTIIETDTDGNILRCSGNTVPITGLSGFSKGCLFIEIDAAANVVGNYENIGTITSCNFNALNSDGSGAVTVSNDGTGDYTGNTQAAVQAAVDAVLAAGGGKIKIKGTYNFTTGVLVTLSGKSLIIEGDGEGTIINNVATSSSAANSCFRVVGGGTVGADRIVIRDLQIVGNSTGGMGIRLESCYQGELTNIRAKNFTAPSGWGVGVELNFSIDCTITNLIATGCFQAGLQLENIANANTIIGGWIYSGVSGGAGVRVISANGNTFLGTIIESNNAYGAVISGNKFTKFYGCWFEANTNTALYIDELGTVVDGCWFESSGTLDIDVRATATDVYITKNRFNDGGKITLRSGATRPNIKDNINITTITDSGAVGPVIRNNGAYNPEAAYAQGNVTGAVTFDRVNGSTITATATGNITATVTNGKAKGDRLTLRITQDATGSRTISKPSNVKLVGGAFSPTATASATDQWELEWDGTNWNEVARSLNVS